MQGINHFPLSVAMRGTLRGILWLISVVQSRLELSSKHNLVFGAVG